MPKAPAVEVKGMCGFTLSTKTWRSGHSIKCERRGASCIRYWKPDKTLYGFVSMSDIEAEVWDFCRTCSSRNDREDEEEEAV